VVTGTELGDDVPVDDDVDLAGQDDDELVARGALLDEVLERLVVDPLGNAVDVRELVVGPAREERDVGELVVAVLAGEQAHRGVLPLGPRQRGAQTVTDGTRSRLSGGRQRQRRP
jgi:hypothetical protein